METQEGTTNYESFSFLENERHNPFLVQVVEELGEKASGEGSKLEVEEISLDYHIKDYDGYESIDY